MSCVVGVVTIAQRDGFVEFSYEGDNVNLREMKSYVRGHGLIREVLFLDTYNCVVFNRKDDYML